MTLNRNVSLNEMPARDPAILSARYLPSNGPTHIALAPLGRLGRMLLHTVCILPREEYLGDNIVDPRSTGGESRQRLNQLLTRHVMPETATSLLSSTIGPPARSSNANWGFRCLEGGGAQSTRGAPYIPTRHILCVLLLPTLKSC